jgi:uncharacterized membrane protein
MTPSTDKQLESAIADTLRFGVLLAAIAVVVGGGMYLHHPSTTLPDYSHFHATPTPLRTVILIATPVARVIVCIIGFSRQRDGIYIAVSTTVLIILTYSLFQGGR